MPADFVARRAGLFGLVLGLVTASLAFCLLREGPPPRDAQSGQALALAAWSVLRAPATGQTGKAEALAALVAQGRTLKRVDLSCAMMGGGWAERELRCARPVDLQGLRLSAAAGQRVSFEGADLCGVDLRYAVLPQVDVSAAQLQGADLREARLSGALAQRADLRGARLDGAHLEAADLFMAQMQGADLRRIVLEGAVLWNAGLQRADARDARLRGAQLWGADLRQSDLRGADLRDALVTGADFRAALFDATTKMQGAWACADALPKGLRGCAS